MVVKLEFTKLKVLWKIRSYKEKVPGSLLSNILGISRSESGRNFSSAWVRLWDFTFLFPSACSRVLEGTLATPSSGCQAAQLLSPPPPTVWFAVHLLILAAFLVSTGLGWPSSHRPALLVLKRTHFPISPVMKTSENQKEMPTGPPSTLLLLRSWRQHDHLKPDPACPTDPWTPEQYPAPTLPPVPPQVLELEHFVCSLVRCSISSLVGETPGHRCGLRGRNVLWNHVRVCSGTHNSLTNWTLPFPSVNTGPRASESTEGGSVFNILKLC